MSDSLPTGPVWDLELALKGVDGCVTDLKELLEIFLRQMPELVSDIRIALETNEADKLHLAAHTLKGSLQILCADAAEKAAADLETAGKKGQVTNGSEMLRKLETELARVREKSVEFLAMS